MMLRSKQFDDWFKAAEKSARTEQIRIRLVNKKRELDQRVETERLIEEARFNQLVTE